MCNCASCKATDRIRGGFDAWPKGDRPPSSVYGRKKIPADKAYTAHWNHCGAEAHKTRAKLDMKQFIPAVTAPTYSRYSHWKNMPRPATIRLPHTRLNQSGWRERMTALNAASINREG